MTNHLANLSGGRGIDELARHCRHQLVDARVLRQPFFLEIPNIAESFVPEVEAPVAREYADRFEEVVEGRSAYPKQGVAGRSQPHLLGPIFEEHA
jgi:hypothetical protein